MNARVFRMTTRIGVRATPLGYSNCSKPELDAVLLVRVLPNVSFRMNVRRVGCSGGDAFRAV